MKVTEKKQEGLHHSFEVVVAAEDIERQIDNELSAVGQRTKIPGFRPGHVPMNILRQRYGKDVMGDVIQNSVNKATRELITERDLRPALQPDINITDYEEGGDLKFELSFDALPEVPEVKYEDIEITKYTFDVDEKEVNEGLERLAAQRKHFHTASEDTKAKEGDAVVIDFVGKKDGEPFQGGTAKGHTLELGAGQFISGFEEQLVGTKAGDEVEVKVTFPEQYHSADLAGQDAVFDVTVHEVKEVHAPVADDAFAESLGFESLDKLKDAVREQIASEYEQAARNKAKKELFDWMDENVSFDVPAAMKNMEFDAIWKQLQEAKEQGDPSLDGKSDDELREEYERIAERRVRLGIFLSEVGRKNSLQVTKEELTNAIMQQARMFPGQEEKIFEFYQQNPNHVDELRGPIMEEKTVDFVLDKAKRTEKKVSVEELLAPEGEEGEAKPKKKAAAKKSTAKKSTEKKSTAKKPAAKKTAAKKPAEKAKKQA